MVLLSSQTFYSRHHIEVTKFVSKYKKSLYITANNPDSEMHRIINTDVLTLNPFDDLSLQFDDIDTYERIIVTDIFEVIPDIYQFLKILNSKLNPNSTLVISTINNVWNPILKIFEFFNIKEKSLNRSYIPIKKINTIASSAGFEIITSYTRQFIPFEMGGLGNILNNVLEALFFKFNFGIRTYLILKNGAMHSPIHQSKTIIVPAKNEEGNLENLIKRIPSLGKDCEIIISCGESEDNTLEIAKKINSKFFNIRVIEQSGRGKANAVWEAIECSKGNLIAILDADISVEPEVLPDFFEIIESNRADFVNGTRLIYKMEKGAMRFINILGNRVFQKLISILIKQPITDSLCGTKVFRSGHYEEIKKWQNSISPKDPFGDFDLLFSSAIGGNKILELPVHYKSRTYGKTQISRFRDGYKLIKYLISSFIIFNTSK
tara:strand:+ start:684 stop:1985 length:1302 start_codon:yes stop_codon:yes gene_type:complete